MRKLKKISPYLKRGISVTKKSFQITSKNISEGLPKKSPMYLYGIFTGTKRMKKK